MSSGPEKAAAVEAPIMEVLPPAEDSVKPERTAPERIGRYELCFELASGGMATVYLARVGLQRDAVVGTYALSPSEAFPVRLPDVVDLQQHGSLGHKLLQHLIGLCLFPAGIELCNVGQCLPYS